MTCASGADRHMAKKSTSGVSMERSINLGGKSCHRAETDVAPIRSLPARYSKSRVSSWWSLIMASNMAMLTRAAPLHSPVAFAPYCAPWKSTENCSPSNDRTTSSTLRRRSFGKTLRKIAKSALTSTVTRGFDTLLSLWFTVPGKTAVMSSSVRTCCMSISRTSASVRFGLMTSLAWAGTVDLPCEISDCRVRRVRSSLGVPRGSTASRSSTVRPPSGNR